LKFPPLGGVTIRKPSGGNCPAQEYAEIDDSKQQNVKSGLVGIMNDDENGDEPGDDRSNTTHYRGNKS